MSEVKWFFNSTSTVVDATANQTYNFTTTGPANGTGKNQKIGNRVRFKYAQFRGIFQALPGTQPIIDDESIWVRLILWTPRIPSGAVDPTSYSVSSVLDDAQVIVSPIRNDIAYVHSDRMYLLGVRGANEGDTPSRFFWKKKFRFVRNVDFRAGANNQLILEPNTQLHLSVITNYTIANRVNIAMSTSCRISFIDI